MSKRTANTRAAITTILMLAWRASSILAQQQGAPRPDLAPLQRAIEQIARESRGQLGAGVELLETGQSLVVGEGLHYPMQSVYKLPIAMATLALVDRGTLRLEQQVDVRPTDFVSPGQHSPIRDAHPEGTRLPVRELIHLAVSESDGTASDVLLVLAGGPASVMDYLRRIGVRDVSVATTEREIGRDERVQFQDWTTPGGCVALLRALHGSTALADSSRALLFRDLTSGTRGNKRIAGLLPPGTAVAHKPGTSGTIAGVTAATNDIGIVTLPDGRHLAVAVLLTNSRGDDAARDSTIARVARAAWDVWVQR